MSLNIIVGRPGSGKSYEAVAYHVLPAIKSGRRVVTNLPLNISHFEAIFGSDVLDLIYVRKDEFIKDHGVLHPFSTPEHFTSEEWRNEQGQGPLFVIDECHFQYPKNGRNKKANDDLLNCLEYFSMHRHYGHDILFMTQSLGKLHRDLRDMIEIQFLVSKHAAVGSDKTYTRKVYDGAGVRPACVSEGVRRYDKTYFPFYKSHTLTEDDVQEAKSSDIVPLWKRWWLWLAVLMIFLGIPMGVSSFNKMISKQSTSMTQPEKPAPVVSATPQLKPPSSPQRKGPFDHMEISIIGHSEISSRDRQGSVTPHQEYYLRARTKASYTFEMKISDLMMAGYEVYALGPCILRLVFDDREQFIYCEGQPDRPRTPAMESILDAVPSLPNH
jgi:zona occludens toxin